MRSVRLRYVAETTAELKLKRNIQL